MDLRQTGIEAIGQAPWGAHFCQFYQTKQDLAEILVPYFKAGLENEEFCMWVTSPPLGVEEAWEALGRAVPDLASYRRDGRIEIIPHTDWYVQGGKFDQDRVLKGWVRKLDEALARGCAGLRLTGNTFWLEKSDWESFAEYEGVVDGVIGQYRMIALCTYSLQRCGASEIADVIKNHQFALLKRGGTWELIESFDRRRMRDAHAKELALERERLAVTLHSIGDAVIATDTTGRVTMVNRVAEELTGWPQAEAAGQSLENVFRIVNEITGAPTEDPVRKALQAGSIVGLANHTALIARDGTRRSIADSAAPIRGTGGDVVGVVLVFRDVTESRKNELELQRSVIRFELLLGTAERLLQSHEPQEAVKSLCARVMEHLDCQVFFNFLVDGGRLRLNAFAGIPAEEARKIEWLDLGVAVCGCVAREGRRIVAERIPETPDERTDLIRSYGVRAYACHPLLGPGGRVLGTLSFGTRTRDSFREDELSLMRAVADQVAFAMARLRDEEALREADRHKNEFLAMLSHELRNPLAPIRNSLFVLGKAAPGGEQAKRAQAVIDRQVKHLTSLVDDLLDVTRIARGKIQLQFELLELGDLVRHALDDQRPDFAKSGVELEARVGSELMWLKGDETRISQIVGNLLQNAAKFTPRGGRVAVTLERADHEALLRVRDTGVGIPPGILARLFQPFTQAEQTLDRSRGGLGLGLALVKGLVELHGGSISAASDGAGRGAEFTVRLPLTAAPEKRAHPAKPPATRRRRVLVIEDNTDAADSLKEALEFTGHEVRVAYDGTSGIAAAREFRPEFVLCDIGLPGMSGHEVAQAFREDRALRSAVLVAVSGYTFPEDRKRALDAGFAHHVAKPPSLEDLERILGSAGA